MSWIPLGHREFKNGWNMCGKGVGWENLSDPTALAIWSAETSWWHQGLIEKCWDNQWHLTSLSFLRPQKPSLSCNMSIVDPVSDRFLKGPAMVLAEPRQKLNLQAALQRHA